MISCNCFARWLKAHRILPSEDGILLGAFFERPHFELSGSNGYEKNIIYGHGFRYAVVQAYHLQPYIDHCCHFLTDGTCGFFARASAAIQTSLYGFSYGELSKLSVDNLGPAFGAGALYLRLVN